MAIWTDESRAALVKAYLAEKPTPENSMEIVAKIAPDFDSTPNGARRILDNAKVYIKKDPVAAKAATKGDKKETKQESLDRLTKVIEAEGLEADDAVISKLTGKAAAYFADTFTKALVIDEETEE